MSPRTTGRLLITCLTITWAIDVELCAQAYKGNIDGWTAQDAIDPPPENALLFIGSSSIRLWENLALNFSEYDVIQRGFGGSHFSDLNQYVDQIVLPYNPLGIVVFVGGNDVASGKSADTVFQDYQTFVDRVHSGQSSTRDPIPIFFIGITPTPSRWACCQAANTEVNSLIQQHVQSNESLYYVDAPSQFLATSPGPNEPPSESLFQSDRLHLNQDGYDIWTKNVKPRVQSVVPSPKRYEPNPLHPSGGGRLLIDFGPNLPSESHLTLGADENGNTWNNWLPANQDRSSDRVLAGRHMGNLVSTLGDNTGIGLVITGEFSTGNKGLTDPDGSLLGDFAIESATNDAFVSGSISSPGGFMVTGLDADARYSFRFFASRSSIRTLSTEYIVTGRDVLRTELQTSGQDIGIDGEYDGNDHNIASVIGVRADKFGRVFVDLEVAEGSEGSVAFINAMEITVLSIPEPSCQCLLMIGGISLFAARRRHTVRARCW